MNRKKRIKWAKILYGDNIIRFRKIYIKIDCRRKKRRFFEVMFKDRRVKKIRYARFKMEVKLKRRLKIWEIVHHKDENTLNDKYYNLKVKANSKHSREHMIGKKNALGNKHKLSKETKRRMSMAKRNMSEETKRKMSMAKMGNKYGLGHIISEETRKKINEAIRRC